MGKEQNKKKTNDNVPKSRSIEESEQRCIAYATSLAEKKLADGTASSQITMHYLKQGTEKARLEVEKIRLETELVKAKTEMIKAQQKNEELFANAIAAMRHYSGNDSNE